MTSPLEAILAPGFEAKLYRAAREELADAANPLRFNNYAYSIRELARHVLHRLAPDSEVVKCDWYKKDPTYLGAATRNQRAQYAVQGGLTESYVRDTLNINIDDVKRRLTAAIDTLSKFTHIDEATFGLNAADVDAHVNATEGALNALCETIQQCRDDLREALTEEIDDAVVNAALDETILEIDELATHHTIEEIYTADVEIVDITSDRIVLTAEGTIDVTLQWGSNSDVARDDGAVMSASFPFSCSLSASVFDPHNVESDVSTLTVDTTSWRFEEDFDE